VPSLDLIQPGDESTLTGGYIYNRRLLEALAARGWRTTVHSLQSSFPLPTDAALHEAREVLDAIPTRRLVLVDGLALGGMPELIQREAQRLCLVALVHHPLAMETGLDAATAAALERAERRALAAVRGVIVTSHATASALTARAVAAQRIGVVEPGTDPAPPAHGSGGEPVELLCVATVTPRKGHAVLLEALGTLAHCAWRLTCVGSLQRCPATVEALHQQIRALRLEQRVRLLGEVNPTALSNCYAQADLFVLASHYEGYGMALAEALAHALPVLSTRAGAIPDTVPEQAGILVPPGDSGALADSLARLLREPQLRRRLALGAASARAALPDWKQAAARFAAEIHRIITP
jgi:glycosyltransferase involved in cell wall biosynthesis